MPCSKVHTMKLILHQNKRPEQFFIMPWEKYTMKLIGKMLLIFVWLVVCRPFRRLSSPFQLILNPAGRRDLKKNISFCRSKRSNDLLSLTIRRTFDFYILLVLGVRSIFNFFIPICQQQPSLASYSGYWTSSGRRLPCPTVWLWSYACQTRGRTTNISRSPSQEYHWIFLRRLITLCWASQPC